MWIHVLSNLEEMLDYLPVMREYYGRPAKEKMPLIFMLYAKLRQADVFFDGTGHVSGYSEPSIKKDPILKELHILSMEAFLTDGIAEDMRNLWASLQLVSFQSSWRGWDLMSTSEKQTNLPVFLSEYLVTGPSVENNAQSSPILTQETADILESFKAKRIYEVSGDIDLFGDRYTHWERYMACMPEEKTRFLDELCRRVGKSNFGLLCDFANYADAGVDPAYAVSVTRPLIRHVHMKDCHLLSGDRVFPGDGWYVTPTGGYWRCAITGQGNLPLYACLKSLREGGYDGWLIQEFEGIEDPVYAVTQGLRFTKRLLKAIDHGVWKEEE